MLNISTENRRPCPSLTTHILLNDVSQFCWNVPRKTLRPKSPKPVEPSIPSAGAGTKAARFRYHVSRCSMVPEVKALAAVSPGAKLGVVVSGRAVPYTEPPAESVTRKGKPD